MLAIGFAGQRADPARSFSFDFYRRAHRFFDFQFQPGFDFHGRLRLAVRRIFSGKLGIAVTDGRAFAQYSSGAGSSGADSFRADLRYDVCHYFQKNLGAQSFAGRARSHVAPARGARAFGTRRRFDALRFCAFSRFSVASCPRAARRRKAWR
jgi:hypothetical protein